MHVWDNMLLLSFGFLKKVHWLKWEDYYKPESNTNVINMPHLPNKEQKEDVIGNYQTGKLETFWKLFSTIMGQFIKAT